MNKVYFYIIIILFATSCKMFNPNQMLRTDKNYQFTKIQQTDKIDEYKLAPNDEFTFAVNTNDGEKLSNPILLTNQIIQNFNYLIEFDGMVKMPLLGRVNLSGLTIRQAEIFLEEKYGQFYNKPFVQIKVINNKVTIFPGGQGGNAMVLQLTNTNTTVLEALAKAGGINDGKAHRIKIIRGNNKNPQVFLVDLSTVDGMKNTNMVLMANDIIYVEPRNKIPQRIMENITPYLTLITTLTLIFTLVSK